MLIVPAIDLAGGACVRLSQGRFDQATQYGDPFAQLAAFARAGAEWVHVVDLDGAKAGKPAQYDLIGKLASCADVKIQCGGGVREEGHVRALLDAGVARVVVGSAAVRRPDEVRGWIETFGVARLCIALDVRERDGRFYVATQGWTEMDALTLQEALALFPPGALKHVLVTDISRDGVLTGPNVALTRSIVRARPDLRVQASGGVAALGDLAELRAAGAAGVIVGRALYERRFTLEDALAG
jgi:phosphoribosylformimino-5-aminoimidazole carboxamide ribotide isomerase